MSFASLIVFAALPLCLAIVLWAFWRRVGQPGSSSFLESASERWVRGSGIARRRSARSRVPRGVLLVFGTVLVVIALARPQWGSEPEVTFDQAREVVIALDLSQSMLADDVTPTRLDRSKLLIESLLGELQGERVGLVVFAGTAFLQVPLSADYEVMREILPELEPAYLPQGGSDFDSLLRTATKSFHDVEGKGDRFLIVLSDGEAHEDSWRKVLPELRKKGIRVVSLGVGTPEGGLVPDAKGGFVKAEDGSVVLSRLAPATLEELARETGGVYTDASAWVDISEIVNATVEQGREGDFVEETQTRLLDRFQWFLGPGLFLLLLAFWQELPVNPVARSLRNRGPAARVAGTAAAALLFLASAGSGEAEAQANTSEAAENRIALEETVRRMIAQEKLAAKDYEKLAHATLAHLRDPETKSAAERAGVVDDALGGIERGEAIDPEAADWQSLREQLASLREPPTPPESQPQESEDSQGGDSSGEQESPESGEGSEGESGSESDSEGQTGSEQPQGSSDKQSGDSSAGDSQSQESSSGESSGESEDEAGSSGDQAAQDAGDPNGEQASGSGSEGSQEAGEENSEGMAEGDSSDASEKAPGQSQGEVARREEPTAPLADAGFGDMQGAEEEQAGLEAQAEADRTTGQVPEASPPQNRLVGGGTGDAENADLRQALGGAVGRMESVRKQDAPAVLFQRMQRAEEPDTAPQDQNKKDW